MNSCFEKRNQLPFIALALAHNKVIFFPLISHNEIYIL